MSEQDEIFEADTAYDNILNDSEDEIETEEIPLIQQEIEEPIVKKDKRKGKRSKPISEEHRARLVDNLARGRAKALETRRKNAQLKKIEKEQKMDEKEEKLLNALNKKKQKAQGSDDLLKKIADLEKRLLEKESKPEPKVSKAAAPPPPKAAPPPKPKAAAPPAPPPSPVVPKKEPELSQKELMKLMRSVRR
tara:strand:- start:295 stop:870 length:576 start_codon:yes stop_codon:yes gene_type:complete